ncbi:MAG: 50S ribosomal protein L9 [Limnochordaceae bacterium]|nr:50S ribosomal protein L9 [Limnochordaceae bacterium]
MEVILTQDVKGLGEKGQLVKVADGYGRNFLLPRGMAVLATVGNRKQMEDLRMVQSRRLRRQEREAEALAEKLAGVAVTLTAKAGEGGKLFGSVTGGDIVDALAKQGIVVDKRKVELEEPIKSVGEYTVPVRLLPGRTVDLHVKVEAQ